MPMTRSAIICLMYVSSIDPSDEHLRRQLHRLLVAKSDIHDALRATEYFIAEVTTMQHPLFLSFQQMIVVSYSRPFTKTRSGGQISDKYARFPNMPGLQEMHRTLLDARDQHVAHSDAAIRTITIYPRGHKIEHDNRRAADTSYVIANHTFPLETFPIIKELCRHVGGRLDSDARALLNKLCPPADTPGSAFELLPADDKQVFELPAPGPR